MSLEPVPERWVTHFRRPLWDALELSDEEPYGGLYGTQDTQRRGLVVCHNCGARISDRGLHYRFHVQIAQMFAMLKDEAEREVVGVVTSEGDDEGRLVESFDHGVLVATREVPSDE